MKLLRFGPKGKEKPGIIDSSGKIRDLSSYFKDISGEVLSDDNLNLIRSLNLSKLPLVTGNIRYGCCISDVSKIICVGLNYKDHIRETNSETPNVPVIFSKLCTPTGPDDDVYLPFRSKHTDWEVELGIVIGQEAEYVTESQAQNYIGGYCLANDLSERKFQLEYEGQWLKGKSFRGFAPIGPWLVTKEEVSDIHNLTMWLKVNDVQYQFSNTSEMLFNVNYIVSYISNYMVLMPGDIILTGTPSGVGMGQKPKPIYLRGDETITLGIEKLGTQKQHIYKKLGDEAL